MSLESGFSGVLDRERRRLLPSSPSKVAEIMIGEDKLTHFLGVGQGLLRGASHHVLDEAERSQHDALCVDSMVLLGGGLPEITWKL